MSMHKSYYDYLQKYKFNVEYFEYTQDPKLGKYSLFDTIDKLDLKGKFTLFESPNFLLSKEIYDEYREKTKNFISRCLQVSE